MADLTDRDRLEMAVHELCDLSFVASEYISSLMTDYMMSDAPGEDRICISRQQRNAGHAIAAFVFDKAETVRDLAMLLVREGSPRA